jgi:GT2 family glycosyltransferase
MAMISGDFSLSVVLCTYNPRKEVFLKVIEALQSQTLQKKTWELLIIDNKSSVHVASWLQLSWHPHVRVIREEKPGLANARISGVKASKSGLIVFVDDDNVLDKDFLELSYQFHKNNPQVGCFGGKSLPVFYSEPPTWFKETGISLGCQDYGDELYISEYHKNGFKLAQYPIKAPIGTGMVILKKAFQSYFAEVEKDGSRLDLGRIGNSLRSGEDNDIVLTLVKMGYEIAYVPALTVQHLIPSSRLELKYLKSMAFESNRSWVAVLSVHGICPWKKINPYTYPVRKMVAWVKNRAWTSPLAEVKWKSACGIFKGLSELN